MKNRSTERDSSAALPAVYLDDVSLRAALYEMSRPSDFRGSAFHGNTVSEQAAYAREELQDSFVSGNEMYQPGDLLEDVPHQNDSNPLEENSRQSLEYNAEESDPAYLFSILEEALPKQEPGKTLKAAEQQQKREALEQTWDKVRRWLNTHLYEEERRSAAYIRGRADATSLHLLCKLSHPPEDIVVALVEAAPDTVSWTDTHGWLPLHHACANNHISMDILRILIQIYPEGKVQQDNQSRTPLHFYVTRAADNVTAMTTTTELLSDTGAAALADRGGMLPIHYASAYGTHPAVLAVLAEVYPPALTANEKHGRTPMHLAMVNAHRDASPNTIRYLLSRPDSKATINTRDQDGFLPLNLLALALKGYRTEDPEKRNNVSSCLSMYLEAEPIPAADFLTAIQDLPDWLQDTAVVSKHVRNVLNLKIAKRFPTSILMLDGYMLIVMIVCFEITSENHINLFFAPETTADTSHVALVILFVATVYFILRETIQIFSLASMGSLSNWWKDLGNWLDIGVIVLVTYYAIIMASASVVITNTAFRSGVAFTQGLLWVATIMFLKKTLVDFAVFVGGVFYVVQRLAAFLLATGVILLAFAEMFYFVYAYTGMCTVSSDSGIIDEEICPSFPHCTFGGSLLHVYTMMMGQVNDANRWDTNITAQILFVFYAFLVIILLSNVLIAIVTDSYEIIQNDRAAIVFWNNRLDFVAEMDAIAYAVQRRLCCGGLDHKKADQEVQEGPSGLIEYQQQGFGDDGSSEYFRETWQQVVLLFDANLYDDIDWIESIVYNIFRIICVFFIIPLWLIAGLATAGWLWPPQVREYLFVQKETAISRAELERQKLAQLKGIQEDLKSLKAELTQEMATDREDLVRMRAEVETIQKEVLSDLLQVKELMSSLLGV